MSLGVLLKQYADDITCVAFMGGDATPAEVNAAIEQGSVIIVNANNAKFLLADVNNGIYLFSRSVAKENSLAQIETITATGTGDTWTEIKTN